MMVSKTAGNMLRFPKRPATHCAFPGGCQIYVDFRGAPHHMTQFVLFPCRRTLSLSNCEFVNFWLSYCPTLDIFVGSTSFLSALQCLLQPKYLSRCTTIFEQAPFTHRPPITSCLPPWSNLGKMLRRFAFSSCSVVVRYH